ncbi:extracellular catalytic domain type 1 short-chain-length polyhydroxyalkanoate depolymerase [Azospirillum sp. sgz301742]
MLNLGQTTAKLAQHRRQWEQFLSGGAAEVPGGTGLTEVADFGTNPGNLRMFTHVPAKVQRSAPLVVVLHGCTQTAAGYDQGTGWSGLADRFGFALLLPEQKRTNNPNVCFSWFLPGDTARGSGEVASIRQMIDRMVADHGLDRDRVYVTGLSAGGAMASALLATYPEVFAGGAIVAGLPYGAARSVAEAFEAMFKPRSRAPQEWGDLVRAASPHAGPWPRVSVWHGDADKTVIPRNADEAVKQWLDVHGVGPVPASENISGEHTHRIWRNAAGEEVVELHTLAGMAHGVAVHPGEGGERCGVAGPYILDVGVSSTWRIAASWGLTEGVPEVEVQRPAAEPVEAKPGLGAKIKSAAIKVLRAIGLMKPPRGP